MTQYQDAVLELQSIRDFLRWGVTSLSQARVFFGHGTDNAWDEAAVLVAHALHLQDISPDMLDAKLLAKEKSDIAELFKRRIEERIPAPYLTGMAWFAGLPFIVDQRAIIPRSPIAELIEGGIQPWLAEVEPAAILDLCAGSGCIGLAAAQYFSNASVDLVELSDEVADLAAKNIEMHALQDRVTLYRGDLFEPLPVQQYDIILTNPPYVDAQDYADMPQEFQHEPRLALVAGDDGLSVAHDILANAQKFLTPQGLLVLEVGNSGIALEEAYPHIPFTWVELERGGVGVAVIHAADLPSGA